MRRKKPLVSIIIPVYNVENFLNECLNSVLNQTYENIEIITVDDGSKDSSPNILKDYEMKYKNFKAYLQRENQGQGVARNIGLDKSQGKYILFVDSDDYIELNTVEYLVNEIVNEDVDFVRFNATSFSFEGEAIKEEEYKFSNYLKESKVYDTSNFKDVYLSFMPSPVLYMFKKQIVIDHNIAFPSKIIHEDEVFSALLFLYANSCTYVNEFFYKRRYRTGSTMTERSQKHINRSFESYLRIIKIYKEILSDKMLTSNQRFFLDYRINSIYHPLVKQIEEESKKQKLAEVSEKQIIYTTFYKNYIRLLKSLLILKNKL